MIPRLAPRRSAPDRTSVAPTVVAKRDDSATFYFDADLRCERVDGDLDVSLLPDLTSFPPAGQAKAMPLEDLLSAAAYADAAYAAATHGEQQTFDWRPPGSDRTFEVEMGPRRSANGTVVGLLVVLRAQTV